MTEVKMGDEVIVTDLPAEAVADLQQPAEQPQEPAKEPKNPEQTEKPVEAKTEEPAKPAETPEVKGEPEPEAGKTRKPKPIASLLEKKREAEERAEAAEARAAELETKVQQLSKQPDNAQTDDEIKALAEELGIEENVLSKIVSVARKGMTSKPELPKEVQDLLAERQREKEAKAEETAFNRRVDGLSSSLKDDLLKKPEVRAKLQELAYSTDKAPDGEPYYQKEIAELYFAFVKPEFEPGKVSAESSQGGTKATEVLDFEAILNDDAKMEEFAKTEPIGSPLWQKFVKWRDEKQGDVPIRRSN